MEAIDRVVIEIQSRNDDYLRKAEQARRASETSFKGIAQSASLAETRTRTSLISAGASFQDFANKTRSSASIVGASLKGMMAGFVSVLGVRALLAVADAAKNLEATLRLATNASGSFVKAQQDVRRIAAETRIDLDSTATLYATFQRNARELGITQEQAARATETVTKAFTISGASAAEAAGGLRQFLQGIQSGTLRGEELNSVLENAPRLARLIADSLGVTIGQLRALGQAGKLSGDQLIDALTNRKFTAGIDEEFKQLPVTFDQAMTQLQNAAVITFGAFDRGGEFSTALATFVTGGTQGFADLEQSAFRFGVDTRALLEGLYNVFDPMVEGGRSAFDAVASDGKNAAAQIRDAFQEILEDVDLILTQMNKESPSLGGLSIADIFGVSKTRMSGFRHFGFPNLGFEPNAPSNLAGRNKQGADRVTLGATRRQIMARTSRDVLAEFGMSPAQPSFRGTAAGGPKTKGRKGPSAESLAASEERREQAFRDELARLNADILDARKALATSADILDQFEKQEIEDRRAAQAEEIEAGVRLKKYRDDGANSEAAKLRAANELRAQLETELIDRQAAERRRKDAAEAEEQRVQVQTGLLQSEEELLRSRADIADTAKERRDLELRIVDLQFEEERIRLESIIAQAADLAAIEQKTEADKKAAAAAKAQATLAEAQLATLPERQANARHGTAERNLSPLEAWAKDAANINEAFEQIAAGGLDEFVNGITDAITGARSLGDAFSQMAQSIIRDLIAMTIKMLIFKALQAAFGLGGQGSAEGGVVGKAATGGFVRGPGGPKGDKIPMMLSNGEFVIQASSTRRLGVPFLNALNEGRIRGLAEGGVVNRTILPNNARAASPGGGGTTVVQPLHLDLRGAVMTHDLLRHMNAIAAERASQAAKASFDAGQKTLPGRLRRYNQLGN